MQSKQDRIMDAYRETGSMVAAARVLGVSRGVVHQAIRRSKGRCVRCNDPAETGKCYCRPCLDKMGARNQQRAEERKARGVCIRCQGPLAPTSTMYCTTHHTESRESLRASRQRRSTGPKPLGGARVAVDHDAIFRVFEETGSLSATAAQTGRPYPTVHQVVKQRGGPCRLCGNTPRLPSKLYCAACMKQRAANEREIRRARLVRGACELCESPIAWPSRTRCAAHPLDAKQKRLRRRETERTFSQEKKKHTILRGKYGDAGVIAWVRDSGQCVICRSTQKDQRICVHHIDCDRTHNVPENLILLCFQCHQFVHSLMALADRNAAVSWVRATYPALGL